METIQLSEKAREALKALSEMLPEIDVEQLAETALLLTATLYQKIADGAIVQLKTPSGKIEELRFKGKKNAKNKPKESV